jgi:DNA polymerase type B, organellar and viral
LIRDFPSYILRKNHKTSIPNRLVYFDTETTQEDLGVEQFHKFKLGWSCYVQQRADRGKNTEVWEYWDDTYGFNAWLQNKCKQKTTLTLIGHNIFYDLQVSGFFKYFTLWGWKLSFCYNKGLTYILVIRKDKAVLRALSTTNYFNTSLKALGEMIGLEKLDVDFDTVSDEELSVYCRRDVEIVKLAMEKYMSFLAHNDMGKFCMSKSGQAFAAFRHRFMNKKIYIHGLEDVSEFERNAYYGGRVECFRLGKQKGGPFVVYDVNSLYPFVMRTYQYPSRLIDYQDYPDMDMLKCAINNRAVIAEVRLRTDEPAYALRKDKKVLFPIGTFNTFLCTEGLRYAIAHNHLLEVIRAYYYEKEWIFQDYVDYFYELRKHYKSENNYEYEQFCKYLLNTLYGKFGQKTTLEEIWEDITYDGYYREEVLDLTTGKKNIITKLFNVCVEQWGEKTAKNAFVAIAAHVTEYGRFTLWKILNAIGRDKVLYCDTDSVMIRKNDVQFIDYPINQTDLGALKKEQVYRTLILHGPKDYQTDKNMKRKGIPKNAEEIEPNKYQYTQWMKQDTHLRRQVEDRYITRTTIKTLKRKYEKGIVNADGSVDPFTFSILDLPL